MNKLPKLFIKNALLAFFFLLAVGAISTLYLPTFFDLQTQKQIQTIEALGNSLNSREDDYSSAPLTAAYLYKLIKDVGTYNVLTLKHKKETLHEQSKINVQPDFFFYSAAENS